MGLLDILPWLDNKRRVGASNVRGLLSADGGDYLRQMASSIGEDLTAMARTNLDNSAAARSVMPGVRQQALDAMLPGLLGMVGAVKAAGKIDARTGLPLNADGTVTLYHGTTKAGAEGIKKTGKLISSAEPDVYVTTAKSGTGYGDGTVVALRIKPSKLTLNDEFPDGRRDFSVSVGAGKSLPIIPD